MPETSPPAPVVIGLGANLGRPREQLARALDELRAACAGPVRVAGLYQSAPWGPAQPDFLNTAAAVDFPGALLDLLDVVQGIESRLGRVREQRWGPRTIDLDLLWAGRRQVQVARLVVPHAELTQRAFAVLPLLELFPNAVEPEGAQPYSALLPSFHCQRIEKIAEIGWELDGPSRA